MPRLALTGSAYELSSLDVSRQRAVNMFPSTGNDPQDANTTGGVMLPTAGLKELVDTGNGGPVRAIIEFDGTLYVVSRNELFKLSDVDLGGFSATATSVGTLLTSTGQISFDINPTQIFISDGLNGYIHTVSTDTFAQITDSDFTGATTVTFFDSFFIYNTPNASTMFATDINDGSSINPLNVATAEGKPDKLVAVITDKRELWAFGEKTIEIWINTANAVGFPLTRRDGAFSDRGCGAAFSVLRIDNTLMWLDDRGFVVMARGYGYKTVSTEAINQELSTYETISDAYAWENIDRGHIFYMITFPTENKTWGYDLTTGRWHERSFRAIGASSETEHIASSRTRFKQTELIGSRVDGKVYIMSDDLYDDDGIPIHRTRVTQHVDIDQRLVRISAFDIPMETGKANSTGTGSDPIVMFRYSTAGGYPGTYSYERTESIGKTGEYSIPVRFTRVGSGRDWVFEIRITAPVRWAMRDPIVSFNIG